MKYISGCVMQCTPFSLERKEMAKREGYAICFNEWLFDNRIKNELPLLLLISSLCAKNGICYGSNSYFAEKFNMDEKTVSRKIKKLEKLNYIQISYIKRGFEIQKREIRVTNLSLEGQKNHPSGDKNVTPSSDKNVTPSSDKNVTDNITSINSTSIDNNNYVIVIGQKQKKFVKPSLREISDYCKERNNDVNPERFLNYYEANGWKVGRNNMKDWKAAIRTWEVNCRRSGGKKNNEEIDGWHL